MVSAAVFTAVIDLSITKIWRRSNSAHVHFGTSNFGNLKMCIDIQSSSVDIQQWVITRYCWSGTAQQRSAGVSGNLWRAFLKESVDCLALVEIGRAF